MKLNELEIIALTGLQSKEREMILRLQQEEYSVLRSIEKRLGLDEGAIGKSHAIDFVNAAIIDKPKEEKPALTVK